MLYQLSYSRENPLTFTKPADRSNGSESADVPRLLHTKVQSNRIGGRYGGEGNRTPDLLNAIQALSQLSYTPLPTADNSHN